jgi:hypothetical protein
MQERVLLEYSWGSVKLNLGMRGERCQAFMAAMVKEIGPKRGGSHKHEEEQEPREGDGKYKHIGSWVSGDGNACCGMDVLLGWNRTFEVTSHRVRILSDAGFTVTTYWKDSLTEADVGPIAWVDPFCSLGCCKGWNRPKAGDPTPLSLNFGWETAPPASALPGTELKVTEQFVFPRAVCNEILSVLDPVIGNFCHNLWSPDPIGEAP